MSDAPLIYVIAGEPSGDLLGGRIMAALKEETHGQVRFAGIGGARMAEQGLTSLVPLSELAVMGLAEVLPHAPRILRRIKQTVGDISTRQPDIVVTIDSSGFNWRVARRLREAGNKVKLVHVVAPMVWAWRAHRAAEVARWYDRLLVLLPFEPPYFEKRGLATEFIGHPVIESGADKGDGAGFRTRHGIAPDTPLIAVLPGSRKSEVGRLLPVLRETIALLAAQQPNLRVVVPTVSHLADLVSDSVASWKAAPIVVDGDRDKHDAFAASNAALHASGTVALELAMARLPAVTIYRLNPLTYEIVRRMVRVDYVNLVNLLLGRPAVPEFVRNDGTPERLMAAVSLLLHDADARAAQIAAYDAALAMLGSGGEPPSRRAARQILGMLSS
ncbi:MAG TPA: lipid-A-disaccharide synthase [Stellaceae bacterium]